MGHVKVTIVRAGFPDVVQHVKPTLVDKWFGLGAPAPTPEKTFTVPVAFTQLRFVMENLVVSQLLQSMQGNI